MTRTNGVSRWDPFAWHRPGHVVTLFAVWRIPELGGSSASEPGWSELTAVRRNRVVERCTAARNDHLSEAVPSVGTSDFNRTDRTRPEAAFCVDQIGSARLGSEVFDRHPPLRGVICARRFRGETEAV